MIGVLSSTSLGFGDPDRGEIKIDRRDRKIASPADLVVVELLEKLFRDQWPEADDDGLALFIWSSKNVSAHLAARFLSVGENLDELIDQAAAGGVVGTPDALFSPLLTICGLPNLDGYLACRTLGIASHVDHISCDPWSDVASLLLAYHAVSLGDADRAAIAGAYVDPVLEAELVLQRAAKRDDALLDPRCGGVGVVLGEVDSGNGAREIAQPLLSVNGTPDVKREQLERWFADLGPLDKLVWMSANGDATWAPPIDEIAKIVERRGVANNGLDAVRCLVEHIGTEPFALVVDYGYALAAIAVT